MGGTVPLAELGHFIKDTQQQVIYHKDLQPLEYVIANTTGRLGAPIYGMLQVGDLLQDYVSPDGVIVESSMAGVPVDTYHSGFEWGGEWTVTYETFRDMGLAFGVALVLIYMLVVWEFKNFMVPVIVMAPIPLTLIGIIPGHWLIGAEFTATSMIGFIALAGIIVRNSLLLVDFARQEIAKGVPIVDAVIYSCQARTRPILITGAALVLGSSVILFDPIFQGMAVSLMFGVVVSTMLTLIVIPLGCVTARAAMCSTMNQGMENPSVACESSAINVNLDSAAHAGDIHVHPVHPLPVAPADVFDKNLQVREQPLTAESVLGAATSKRVEVELVSVEMPLSAPHVEDKSEMKPIVSIEATKVQDASTVNVEVSANSLNAREDKVVELIVEQPALEPKPTKSTRVSKANKPASIVDNDAIKTETVSVVIKPEEADTRKNLSQRPRRGIKIKGQE
jgi:hypothetical protein